MQFDAHYADGHSAERQRVRVLQPADPMLTQVMHDGTMRYLRDAEPALDGKPMRYEIEIYPGNASLGTLTARRAFSYVHLVPGSAPAEAVRIARRISGDAQGRTQSDIVERLRHYVSTRYDYLLPGVPGATESLEDFVNGRGGGHCEYFATALAVMLRSLSIPCRLVTGYRCEEWDEKDRVLTVRRKHAHAWLEVRDPGRGWYTVDSSPASSGGGDGSSWLTDAKEWIQALWTKVVTFDDAARTMAAQWILALPGRGSRWLAAHPWTSSLAALTILLAIWVERRRRRDRIPNAVRTYLIVLRKLSLGPRPSETPRELLLRAGAVLQESELERLGAATDAHEQARYVPGKGVPRSR